MSERTQARMASWPPEQRLRVAFESIDAWFDGVLAAEMARGATPAEAAERIRRRIREWRRL